LPEIIDFQQAIEQSPDRKKRKVLLGNGFSRACKDDIFSYGALYEQADFGNLSPGAREAFTALGTRDFEIVIKSLRQTAQLAAVYVPDKPELLTTLVRDANGLRDVLVETIARNHPERPHDIELERYAACRRFLDNFNCIYTLNYDLLLYWTLMQDDPAMEFFKLEDGFRKAEEPDADYVAWDSGSSHTQTVYYMHGALHLFDAGHELQKYTWCNTQIPLIEQVKAALDRNDFPLFVAEDSSKAKMERIMHHHYLGKAKSSFEKIGNDLFVFGLAFGESDGHILQMMGDNQVKQMFVSLHGEPNSDANKKIIHQAESIKARRHKYKLDVKYFKAETARVWG